MFFSVGTLGYVNTKKNILKDIHQNVNSVTSEERHEIERAFPKRRGFIYSFFFFFKEETLCDTYVYKSV